MGSAEKGDIADVQKVRAVLERYRPGALMHFAAYAYVGESVEQPLLYYRIISPAAWRSCRGWWTIGLSLWCFHRPAPPTEYPTAFPLQRIMRSTRSIPTAAPSCSLSECWRTLMWLMACLGWHCAISMP